MPKNGQFGRVTDIVDNTHKPCANYKALKIRGSEAVCLLKFEQVTITEPGRWYKKRTYPYEPCPRPKTTVAYSKCRQMLLKDGKEIEKKPQRGEGTLGRSERVFLNGESRAHPGSSQGQTSREDYLHKVYAEKKR